MRKRYIRKDIMLNELENEKLIADCQRCNLSYGEYFRRLLMNENIKDIVLHFDNDIAGRNATKAMLYALDKYNVYDIPAPYGKDINDYLCFKLGLKKRQEIEAYKNYKSQNRE